MRQVILLYAVILAILGVSMPMGEAVAFSQFGDMIDNFCTAQNRTPARPFNGDCTLCHRSGTSANASNRVQPNWDEFLDARQGSNGVAQGDFGFFCAAVVATNQAPVLDPIPDLMANAGQSFTIAVVASDPDGDPIQLSASSGDVSGFDFVDRGNGRGVFSWTPSLAGNYGFRFTATDGVETVFEDVVVSVGNVNLPPVLDSIGDKLGSLGVAVRFLVSASDDDGDNLSFEMSGAPSAATLVSVDATSAEFEWTPTASDAGNYAVVFTVRDDGTPSESDSEEIMISVEGGNRPPTLGSIGNRSVRVGDTLSFPITATDPEGDSLTFSARGLPAGADLFDLGIGSAQFTWSPTAAQVGTYTVEFEVIDSGSPMESDFESIRITVVDDTVQPPSDLSLRRATWTVDHRSFRPGRWSGDDDDDRDEHGDDDDDGDRGRSRRGFSLPTSGGVRGELRVSGSQAPPSAVVVIWDVDLGTVLGETRADSEGRFRFRTRSLSTAPAQVQAEVDGAFSEILEVEQRSPFRHR